MHHVDLTPHAYSYNVHYAIGFDMTGDHLSRERILALEYSMQLLAIIVGVLSRYLLRTYNVVICKSS